MYKKISHIRNFVVSHKIIIFLCIITLWGGFLRFYGGGDLIFFEIDQARDYVLFDEIERDGIGAFPLLGPKAGGTFFRLGPIYYVPTLIVTQIFGVFPYAILLPEVVCAVLTIPLLFFFLREFFDEKSSLCCTALFASSLFFVEYAHFAWNPNYIPFFFLLLLYAMLRYMRQENVRVVWVIGAALSAGIVMQLHTITFVATPIIIGLYGGFLYKRVLWKHIFVFVSIVFLLFVPMVMNEMLTAGENMREFFVAKDKREGKNENSSFEKIVFVNLYNHVRQFTVIGTSQNVIRDLSRLRSSDDLGELMQYNNVSIKEKAHFALIVCLSAVLIFFYGITIRDVITSRKNNEKYRYHFLLLILIVQGVLFVLFLPLALAADSRHFLPLFFMPYVVIGYFMRWSNRQTRYIQYTTAVSFAILLIVNIWGTARWLHMIDHFDTIPDNAREFILEPYYTMTMDQWHEIAQQIVDRSGDHDIIYVQSSTYHVRSLVALMRIAYGKNVRTIEKGVIDPQGVYFILRETEDVMNGKKLTQEIGDDLSIINTYTYGTMMLFELEVRQVTYDAQNSFIDRSDHVEAPCYELQYDVSQRDRCRVQDIGQLFY